MDTPPRIRVGALTIMAARPRELRRFYSKLLNRPYIREEGPRPGEPPHAGYALVCPPEGVAEPALNFDYEASYRRPRWPTASCSTRTATPSASARTDPGGCQN